MDLKRTLLIAGWALSFAAPAPADTPYVEIPADVLADKIHGGLIGQILGNLNGLPHENKYYDQPGSVAEYTPALPDGARTDDDTDIEWVYIIEMQRTGQLLIPPERIVDLWKKHINDKIWCANRYARGLMDLGIRPPLTGRIAVNPWSEFNIAGQFLCEAFGLVAPAMPQTAARIGSYYTHVAVDGEPVQATQLFTTMIATAFIQDDVRQIVDTGLAAVDDNSQIRRIVADVRQWHAAHPDDWAATRKKIHDQYTSHSSTIRDGNGCELNTAAVVGALLHGRGDLVETLRLAFNFGWDADCNAATAGCIVGVVKGRDWITRQGWTIKDAYRNTTRPGIPDDETITRYAERLTDVARKVILNNDGQVLTTNGRTLLRIRPQKPRNIEPLPKPLDRLDDLRRELLPQIERDLTAQPIDQARAAYLALCLGLSDQLSARRPAEWSAAVQALQAQSDIVKNIYKLPPPGGLPLQQKAAAAGLTPPRKK